MSYIRYRSTQTNILWFNYKKVLQKKITDVCRRIGYDDSGVVWEIFDSFVEYADGRRKTSSFNRIFAGIKTDGADYASTDVKKRVVYVSLMAIRLDRNYVGVSLTPNFLPLNSGLEFGRVRKYEDKLANILIDEITHLQTGEDHGSKKYEKQFDRNIKLYYDGCSSVFDRLLYRYRR